MSTVSNRFFVEAIEDGSTLHGQLLSTKPLTQAWTGTTAIPSWTVATNQPIVYVNLLSGATSVTPDSGGTWYYNNTPIEWADDTATALSTDGRFQKVSNYPTVANPTAAIKIVQNLASSSNVNTDSITYNGAYTISGSAIDFSVSTLVRITGVSSSGIFGFIEFVGSNVVTEKNQDVLMRGRLFSADGTEISEGSTQTSLSAFSTTWKMNNVSIGSGSDISKDGVTYSNAKKINESEITDNSIVECTFSYTTNIGGSQTTLTFTTYENVDDQTDYEQMYIQYSEQNDTSATLKKNGSVTFKMWMGTQTDPTVDDTWETWYVKLLDSEGNVVTSNISNIPNTITTGDYAGWRPLDVTKSGNVFQYASITITYDIVNDSQTFKKYLTGIVLAVKS